MTPLPALPSGEVEITTTQTEIHRQVPDGDGFLENGRPSSRTFMLRPQDLGQLSVTRGDRQSAAQACANHRARGFTSVGVAIITVGDVVQAGDQAKAPTRVVDDSAVASGVPPHHAYIDLRLHIAKPRPIARALKLRAAFVDPR